MRFSYREVESRAKELVTTLHLPEGGVKRILVVSDDRYWEVLDQSEPGVRDYYEGFLKSTYGRGAIPAALEQDIPISVAKDGAEALSLIDSLNDVGLIIIDSAPCPAERIGRLMAFVEDGVDEAALLKETRGIRIWEAPWFKEALWSWKKAFLNQLRQKGIQVPVVALHSDGAYLSERDSIPNPGEFDNLIQLRNSKDRHSYFQDDDAKLSFAVINQILEQSQLSPPQEPPVNVDKQWWVDNSLWNDPEKVASLLRQNGTIRILADNGTPFDFTWRTEVNAHRSCGLQRWLSISAWHNQQLIGYADVTEMPGGVLHCGSSKAWNSLVNSRGMKELEDESVEDLLFPYTDNAIEVHSGWRDSYRGLGSTLMNLLVYLGRFRGARQLQLIDVNRAPAFYQKSGMVKGRIDFEKDLPLPIGIGITRRSEARISS